MELRPSWRHVHDYTLNDINPIVETSTVEGSEIDATFPCADAGGQRIWIGAISNLVAMLVAGAGPRTTDWELGSPMGIEQVIDIAARSRATRKLCRRSVLHTCLSALAALMLPVTVLQAQQAEPTQGVAAGASPADLPMQFSIVRLADPACEPRCPEWIAAQGRIDSATLSDFKRVLSRLGNRKLPILIDSAGGAVDASLAMGRLIRARGLDVVVTKTASVPCPPTDAECRRLKVRGIEPGRPEARLSKCASACAFVLAGGIRRYVGPSTLVGLHEIKSIATLRHVQQFYRIEHRYAQGAPVRTLKRLVRERTLSTVTTEEPTDEATYERVAKYFQEMGVNAEIMSILRSAPNSSIRWLRTSELVSTGLATDPLNGEQMLVPGVAGVAAAAPQAAPAAAAPMPTAVAANAAAVAPPASTARPAVAKSVIAPTKAAATKAKSKARATVVTSAPAESEPRPMPTGFPAVD